MQLSTRFSVAIHVLALLAETSDGPLTSDTLAETVSTNPVVIRRVLAFMRRQRLVSSMRGAHGGWRLVRAPESITLREVYRALGLGPVLALHAGLRPQRVIGYGVHATMVDVFDNAQLALESALASVTIADVVRGMQRQRAA